MSTEIEAPEKVKGKEPKPEEIEKAREFFKTVEKYFIFGPESIFDIPVESIHPAPATMCYRKLSSRHVNEIRVSMETNHGIIPAVADLVPYDMKTGNVFNFPTETPNAKLIFLKLVEKRRIAFVAVSGQHSAEAAKELIVKSELDEKLRGQAEKLMYRKSRILSSKTPVNILAAHSQRANVINRTMKYTSSFPDIVAHVRRQYSEL